MGLYETQRRSEGKCRSRAGKGEMPPVWAAASPADPGRTDGGVERERPSWDPKDGELCLERLKTVSGGEFDWGGTSVKE